MPVKAIALTVLVVAASWVPTDAILIARSARKVYGLPDAELNHLLAAKQWRSVEDWEASEDSNALPLPKPLREEFAAREAKLEHLKRLKNVAVQAEDYDAAKKLKVQIEKVEMPTEQELDAILGPIHDSAGSIAVAPSEVTPPTTDLGRPSVPLLSPAEEETDDIDSGTMMGPSLPSAAAAEPMRDARQSEDDDAWIRRAWDEKIRRLGAHWSKSKETRLWKKFEAEMRKRHQVQQQPVATEDALAKTIEKVASVGTPNYRGQDQDAPASTEHEPLNTREGLEKTPVKKAADTMDDSSQEEVTTSIAKEIGVVNEDVTTSIAQETGVVNDDSSSVQKTVGVEDYIPQEATTSVQTKDSPSATSQVEPLTSAKEEHDEKPDDEMDAYAEKMWQHHMNRPGAPRLTGEQETRLREKFMRVLKGKMKQKMVSRGDVAAQTTSISPVVAPVAFTSLAPFAPEDVPTTTTTQQPIQVQQSSSVGGKSAIDDYLAWIHGAKTLKTAASPGIGILR